MCIKMILTMFSFRATMLSERNLTKLIYLKEVIV